MTNLNPGDTISVNGTVTAVHKNDTVDITLATGNSWPLSLLHTNPSYLTLVKKNIPPKPKAGSVIRVPSRYLPKDTTRYVVDHNGKFHYIDTDGKTSPSGDYPGGWGDEHLDHAKVEVLG